MKKPLLVAAAAFMALAAFAAIPQKDPHDSVGFEKNIRLSGPNGLHSPSPAKAPAEIGSAQDVITSVEGAAQQVAITGSGYSVLNGKIYIYENETVASHVVYGEDDEVYIYNILPNGLTNSYVKGKKTGDKVIVDLPQTLFWVDGAEDGYFLAIYEYRDYIDENGEKSTWFLLADDTSMTFSVAEDGTLTDDGLNGQKLLSLGVCSNLNWSGFGASELTIAPFNEKPVEVPADYEVSKNFWLIPCDEYALFVDFAQGGDDMYLQGLAPVIPEAWMRATVGYDGDTATVSIPQNQYLGVLNGYFLYTKCAKPVLGPGGYTYELMPDDYCYDLVWDFEEQKMTAKDKDVFLLYNVGKEKADPYSGVGELELIHQDSYEGVPANPYGLTVKDNLASYGYAAFFFNVPAVSTEGDFLLTEDLSYVLYVDGDEWTFDPEEYELPEMLEEIPWDFNDYWICFGRNSDIEREVDFFVEGISTLGVQSVYRCDGEETRSEIVTVDLDPSAVDAIGNPGKVKDVRFFSLDGRSVAEPAAGIFVKKVTYDDGSVRTFKTVVR